MVRVNSKEHSGLPRRLVCRLLLRVKPGAGTAPHTALHMPLPGCSCPEVLFKGFKPWSVWVSGSVLAHAPKGRQFDSWSGTGRGMWDAANQCFPVSLPSPFSLKTKKKNFFKKKFLARPLSPPHSLSQATQVLQHLSKVETRVCEV